MHPLTMPTALIVDARWERPVFIQQAGTNRLLITISGHATETRRPDRAPLDVAFVLDRSGSMGGKPIELAKEAVSAASAALTDADRVALIVFDNEIDIVQPLSYANGQVKAEMRERLRHIDSRGSTYLSGGWLTGCQELAGAISSADGRVRRVILLTDGQANQGITDAGQLAHHADELRRRGVVTTTVGMGGGYDELLLSDMATSGGGNHHYVAQPGELGRIFQQEIGDLVDLVALDPRLELTLPAGLRAWMLNAFPANRIGKRLTIDLRSLAGGDTVDLVFTATTRPGMPVPIGETIATLTWGDPARQRRESLTVRIPELRPVDEVVFAGTAPDPRVSAAFALEQAASDQREAVKLDREGMFAESRQKFADAVATLQAAPQTEDVTREVRVGAAYAAAPMAPLSEHDRKDRVASHARRSRGVRRPPNAQ